MIPPRSRPMPSRGMTNQRTNERTNQRMLHFLPLLFLTVGGHSTTLIASSKTVFSPAARRGGARGELTQCCPSEALPKPPWWRDPHRR